MSANQIAGSSGHSGATRKIPYHCEYAPSQQKRSPGSNARAVREYGSWVSAGLILGRLYFLRELVFFTTVIAITVFFGANLPVLAMLIGKACVVL